jgi:hypothetical protein
MVKNSFLSHYYVYQFLVFELDERPPYLVFRGGSDYRNSS